MCYCHHAVAPHVGRAEVLMADTLDNRLIAQSNEIGEVASTLLRRLNVGGTWWAIMGSSAEWDDVSVRLTLHFEGGLLSEQAATAPDAAREGRGE
jgi:hypothetical protein